MKTLPFKTVEVKLSRMELDSFREKFGQLYWNDHDGLIFIPVQELRKNYHEWFVQKFYNFFGEVDFDVDGIYINCNSSE